MQYAVQPTAAVEESEADEGEEEEEEEEEVVVVDDCVGVKTRMQSSRT